MCDNICKDCFWEYHGACNYPWDSSECDTPNVPPLCIIDLDGRSDDEEERA